MKTIIDYFRKQDNLLTISAWTTLGIMLLLFIFAQVLAFTGIIDDVDKPEEKMELRELVKLRFTPQVEKELPQQIKLQPKKMIITKSNRPEKQITSNKQKKP